MASEVITFQAITGVAGTGAVDSAVGVISVGITGNAATGSVGIIFGFGWGAIPDSAETWTEIVDNSETWTPI
jgi:hypothetical protein